MSKNKRKKKIRKIVKNAANVDTYYQNGNDELQQTPKYFYEVWVDRPNVAVSLWKFGALDSENRAFGFSKVNWPDCWDEAEGLRIALSKAAAKLVKA